MQNVRKLKTLRDETTQITHSILDGRGKDARVLSTVTDLSKSKQQLNSINEIQCTASRMAHEVQHIAIIAGLLAKDLNAQKQQHEESLSETIKFLGNKIDRELAKINSKCTKSFEEAERRARCISDDLRSKQNTIEVKLVLAEMVMHLAETESMENLDTFMAGCIAKDAAHVQSESSNFRFWRQPLLPKL